MSKYTTELRYICESLAGRTESAGYADVNTIIAESRAQIFNFDYPIFEEEHREELETKILKHYYTQEIGMETYGLWHLELDKRMNEIMPYYNQLYESASLEFNPLDDVNYVKTHEGTHSENENETVGREDAGTSERNITSSESAHTEGETNVDSTDWSLYSDTPQGTIANTDLSANAYLTNATKDTVDSTTGDERDSTREVTSKDENEYSDTRNTERTNEREGENEFRETMKGKVGTYSYAKLLKEYREQILNIDMMIINDLQDLFMMLW